MDESIRPLAQLFEVSTNLFVKALRGIGRAELLTRPADRSNPLLWVAGHLTQSRERVTNLVGGQRDIPWGDLFATGSRIGPPEQYPDGEAILGEWASVSNELMHRLDGLTSASLALDTPMRVPSADGTLRGSIALFAFHEAYHVGQMGYLRKWLGHSPLLDG